MLIKILKLILSSFLLISLLNCSKSEQLPNSISITKSEWTSSTNNEKTMGVISLSIAGTTTCSNITIQTHGDGAISDEEITIDSNKHFDATFAISFTHAPDNTPRTYSTVLTCLDNSITYSLESDYLKFYE
jgi:hypothetical protein